MSEVFLVYMNLLEVANDKGSIITGFLRWGGSDPSVDACLYASILLIAQMI
jgi:hypothetical protein